MNNIDVNDITNKILIVLKDGRVKPHIELEIADLKGIYEKWEYGGLSDPIGQFGAWVVNTLSSAIANARSIITSAIDSVASRIISTISGLSSTLQSAISSIGATISTSFNQIAGYISSVISQISSSFASLSNTITSGISNIISTVSSSISSITSAISYSISSILSSISSISSSMLSAISSGISTVVSSLSSIASNITSMISYSVSSILSGLNNIGSSMLSAISGGISTIMSSLLSTISGISSMISQSVSSILSGLNNIGSSILSAISSGISTIMSSLLSTISGISSMISQSVSSILSGINIIGSSILSSISSGISTIISSLSSIVSSIGSMLQSAITPLFLLMSTMSTAVFAIPANIGKAIDNALATVGKFIEEGFGGIRKTIDDIINDIIQTTKSIIGAFQSFINPLVGINAFLEQKYKDIETDVKKTLRLFGDISEKINDALNQYGGVISDISSSTFNIFKRQPQSEGVLSIMYRSMFNKEMITSIVSHSLDIFGDLFGRIFSIIFKVMDKASDLILTIIHTIYRTVRGHLIHIDYSQRHGVAELYAQLIPEQKIVYSKIFNHTLSVINFTFDIYNEFILSQPIIRMITIILALYLFGEALGIFKEFEVALTPIIAKIGGKINTSSLKNYAKEVGKKAFEEWLKTFIFTFSFWLFEPTKYVLNPFFRGWLPIEVPTLHEIIEITRRYMSDNVYEVGKITPSVVGSTYSSVELNLYDVIAKRGYPPWFDGLITKGYNNYNTKILDRFGHSRIIPSALLFALPPPSDCVRMMLRDMIQSLDDFGKLMLMHGYHPDVSALYFMLHFRYPSTERLFEYACRVASGLVWVDKNEPALSEYFGYVAREEENFRRWGLGFSPATPKELSDRLEKVYPLNDLSKTAEITSKRVSEAFSPLAVYFKWHDLFPMAWIKGQSSDQMIAMELSADIPMRIDARWMYKWGVITEEEVVRVVMARGMHPRWVEKISIAEMMNAMAEERTIVRTGIMNSFKEGFFNEENLSRQLSNLTTIKLLNRDVPVKFLEGEVKLMVLRSKYDRALDILLNAQKSLFYAYAENIVEYEQVKKGLKELTNIVSRQLNIPLYFDEVYYDTYKAGLDVRQTYETVSRIRRYLRYAILEVMNRVRSGYMSKDEIKITFEMIKQHARLTTADVNYFVDLAIIMRSQFDRQIKVQATLKRLSKGLISKEEALSTLTKLGIEEDIAESMIELHAKTYTLSITQYLSYANYIDIPAEWLEKKLDLLGVPDDEKQLILTIFEIRPISSERDSLVKRYLDEFEDGYIDEATLRRNLSRLGVLPRSIDLLVEMKNVEKSMNAKKLLIDATLNKLKRGVIRLDEAVAELKKYIVDENLIYALIERNIRTYSFSPDKMISMSEYVPVDLNWITEKAKLYGYPEEEVRLFPAYAVAREISEEMKRLANELGQAFAEGVISEEDYKKALDELATLGGQAKSKFGVDWIVLSPEERYTLLQLYKVRAIRKLYSEAKKTTG